MPTVLVVVEKAIRASYVSVATEALKKVASLAPVGPIPTPTRARALVVHGVSCWQSIADRLYKVRGLRLGTNKRVLCICWLFARHRRRGKWVSSII